MLDLSFVWLFRISCKRLGVEEGKLARLPINVYFYFLYNFYRKLC